MKKLSNTVNPGRRSRAAVSAADARRAERTAIVAGFVLACDGAAEKSQRELLAVAIARGCRHYAPLWPELTSIDDRNLPHEVLGCALLRGPADVSTFQAIRVGAMVLGDLGNSPEKIAIAADRLGVLGRVAHIARIGSAADEHRELWQRILKALPEATCADRDFLPGVSRLVSETRISGAGRGPARVWLRTNYRR